MAETAVTRQSQTLGVGHVLGKTVSTFFRYFLQIAALGIGTAAIANLIGFWLVSPFIVDPATRNIGAALYGTLGFIASAISAALVIRYVLDAWAGKKMRLANYISSTAGMLFPLLVCPFIAAATVAAAILLFVLPAVLTGNIALIVIMAIPGLTAGLYLAALWSAVTPAIVIERAGFKSLARSAGLTRAYRWPAVGAILVFVSFGVACKYATDLGLMTLIGAGMGVSTSNLVLNAYSAIAAGLMAGLAGVFSATLYARLRALEDGASSEHRI